jgi:hypothetical protein
MHSIAHVAPDPLQLLPFLLLLLLLLLRLRLTSQWA